MNVQGWLAKEDQWHAGRKIYGAIRFESHEQFVFYVNGVNRSGPHSLTEGEYDVLRKAAELNARAQTILKRIADASSQAVTK